MKLPIDRKLKLDVETLRVLTTPSLAEVRGGADDPAAKSRASWAYCPKP